MNTQVSGSALASRESTEVLALQLIDDGFAEQVDDGWRIPWSGVYGALKHPSYATEMSRLQLPPFVEAAPILKSHGSLIDQNFLVSISGWTDTNGGPLDFIANSGAIIHGNSGPKLMPEISWHLCSLLEDFRSRHEDERTEVDNRKTWGQIRQVALAAGARLDAFLFQTVVLTPEKMTIDLRRGAQTGDNVIEVIPGFAGCPKTWIDQFDVTSRVLDRYDLITPNGIVQVIITPQVKTVLTEIKRMPGRRVAGARAEAFLINPFAALGEDATSVINADQYEAARGAAGILFETFTATIQPGLDDYPEKIGLIIDSLGADDVVSTSETTYFDDPRSLSSFIQGARAAISERKQLYFWEGYEFELNGDSERQLSILSLALAKWETPRLVINFERIFDLSGYSARIDSIGIEKPYYSPYIAKKNEDEGWWPENLAPVISWTPPGSDAPVAMPANNALLDLISAKLEEAKSTGSSHIAVPGMKEPMSVKDAESIVRTFSDIHAKAKTGQFDPEEKKTSQRARDGLVVKPNILQVDHAEVRRSLLLSQSAAVIPRSLKADFSLMEHQEIGVAWLQHLYALAPNDCSGALLADDMGLGKTLQLLTVMATIFEQDPNSPPALVVAPLSLLENWKEEVARFFEPGGLRVLTAYGAGLGELRVARDEIDRQLLDRGLVKFLRPGWPKGFNVVLTTYETLRDLEFSFAAEEWSILVCDEAQKIKNPNAMVTRAAKKLKARFRVACTGTPVENTLADLWCLFDFVQPGLLGALNEFGKTYRRPIEAETVEEKKCVNELRERIEPQILRRTKENVAKDLKKKINDGECKAIPLSTYQRAFYAQAVGQFQRRSEEGVHSPFANHLTLLQYLRQVCTDPRPYGTAAPVTESISEYRRRAPKFDWLIRTLERIKMLDDKVILFCEFREIQRVLRRYIEEHFKVTPDIINGDTGVGGHGDSRQGRLKAFQSKPGFGIIILSPAAVGFGVNIQAANHVIHYTRTWNPAKEDQATDRAYRIGQKKDVYVYCPVVASPEFKTFDVRLDELLTWKRALARDMLNGCGDVGPGDFSIEEVAPPEAPIAPSPIIDARLLPKLSPKYFEALVAVLWQRQGYRFAALTPGSGDDGVDVVAIRDKEGVLIQCKSSTKDDGEIGWEAVKDVIGGEAAYKLKYPGINFGRACATNQKFGTNAKRHAEINSVRLIDQGDILELISKHETRMSDIEKMLYSTWGSDKQ